MKYDYTYFRNILLKLQSDDFGRYQFTTEKDLLFHAIENGDITDYNEVCWGWIAEDIYGEESQYGDVTWFDLGNHLDRFISRVMSVEISINLLTFFRDHCREYLFNPFYDEECVCKFETECARLISIHKEMKKRLDAIPDPFDAPVETSEEPNILPNEMELPKYSILEGAILAALKEYRRATDVVPEDVLLSVAKEFVLDFRTSVQEYDESGQLEEKKPCMSQMKYVDAIKAKLKREVQAYNGLSRDPVYQTFFIVACFMGMPDHRRSWWEKNFAIGIGEYLEKTNNYKGCKAKIQQVLNNMQSMIQYQLDFDAENIEQAMDEQTEKLQAQVHASVIPAQQIAIKGEDEKTLALGQHGPIEVHLHFNEPIGKLALGDNVDKKS